MCRQAGGKAAKGDRLEVNQRVAAKAGQDDRFRERLAQLDVQICVQVRMHTSVYCSAPRARIACVRTTCVPRVQCVRTAYVPCVHTTGRASITVSMFLLMPHRVCSLLRWMATVSITSVSVLQNNKIRKQNEFYLKVGGKKRHVMWYRTGDSFEQSEERLCIELPHALEKLEAKRADRLGTVGQLQPPAGSGAGLGVHGGRNSVCNSTSKAPAGTRLDTRVGGTQKPCSQGNDATQGVEAATRVHPVASKYRMQRQLSVVGKVSAARQGSIGAASACSQHDNNPVISGAVSYGCRWHRFAQGRMCCTT